MDVGQAPRATTEILDGTSAESLVRAVTLIPASGEFAYATDIVRREGGDGATSSENVNAEADRADIVVALDRLEACAPEVESVSLVVAWFGDDLRAGHCRITSESFAVWRSPGEDGFQLVDTLGRPARMGRLAADLYPGPVSRFDLGNAAIVYLAFGSLASVTDLALLGGANALAVEAAPGVWEVLQFGVAELIAPGRYRLSRLLRGQRGTEGAMGAPAPADAPVVVLDETLAPLPVTEAALGLEVNWRVGPAQKPVSDRSYRALRFTPEGAGLRPFSVCHVAQPWRTARAPGDLMIRWARRSRALAADSWTAPEVPLAEESEAYEVEILDGAVVRRTLATNTTSVTYTAAQQTADRGALLGPSDALDIRIFQLSELVGRGAPKAAALQF